MATSGGVNYDFTETEKKRLTKAKKQRKKLQKRLAKQHKESNRRKVTKEKIGKSLHQRTQYPAGLCPQDQPYHRGVRGPGICP